MTTPVTFMDPDAEPPRSRAVGSYAPVYDTIREALVQRPGVWATVEDWSTDPRRELSRMAYGIRVTGATADRWNGYKFEARGHTDRRTGRVRLYARAVEVTP